MVIDGRTPLRRNRSFQLLWVGGTVSGLGTAVTWLAFPLLVLAATGSAALAGVTGASRLAATIVLSLPAGVWVDRLDRRRILIGCEGARAITMATLVAAIVADRVFIWHIVAVAVVNGAADAFFSPAHAAAIRAVVPQQQLSSAYAQEEARSHAATLAGPPLGGLLFNLGRGLPFLFDMISYLISMACIVAAKVPRRPVAPSSGVRGKMRADIGEAGRWLWRQHGVRAALALSLIANLAANAVLIPIIISIHDRGGTSIGTGIVLAGMGVGGLIGALVSPRIGRLMPAGRLMIAVVALFALNISAITLPLGPYWPIVPLFLAMIAVPSINVVLQVLVATIVPEDMIGRMISLLTIASMGLAPLGPLLGGILAEFAGATAALLVISGLLVAASGLATISPALRNLVVPPGGPAQTQASAVR